MVWTSLYPIVHLYRDLPGKLHIPMCMHLSKSMRTRFRSSINRTCKWHTYASLILSPIATPCYSLNCVTSEWLIHHSLTFSLVHTCHDIGGRALPTQQQASGFIILETNFKVVAYTGLFYFCEWCSLRRWSRNFAWKVADGVATHSKLSILVEGGWLVNNDGCLLYYSA
jgi:hypothetical protein